jgi:metal-responsive CopG/Arc/MetJ family transcriptional regulator
MTVALPPAVLAAIDRAAQRKYQGRSEYCRQRLLEALQRDGALDGAAAQQPQAQKGS